MTISFTSTPRIVFSLLLCAGLWLSSCNSLDVFEKNSTIPKKQWSKKLQPTFDFNIEDTAASYNLFVVLRHSDAYRYNNIWLNLGTQSPGDSMRYQRVDLTLGSDVKGWYGTGMDDIWEVRASVTNGPVVFKKRGIYRFSVAHIMRENPLPNIMSVGIRVEKVAAN